MTAYNVDVRVCCTIQGIAAEGAEGAKGRSAIGIIPLVGSVCPSVARYGRLCLDYIYTKPLVHVCAMTVVCVNSRPYVNDSFSSRHTPTSIQHPSRPGSRSKSKSHHIHMHRLRRLCRAECKWSGRGGRVGLVRETRSDGGSKGKRKGH